MHDLHGWINNIPSFLHLTLSSFERLNEGDKNGMGSCLLINVRFNDISYMVIWMVRISYNLSIYPPLSIKGVYGEI